MSYEGVLPVFKPTGMTSHDVVAKARRLLGIKRIGHTGTLDPAVSGVLPLCIGRATRIVEWMQEIPKAYEAIVHIGVATSTEDATGDLIASVDEVHITEEKIVTAVQSFLGPIVQIPPMFSALKHEGRRLYEYAREGIEVERKQREAVIYDIQVKAIEWKKKHAFVRFNVKCSKGTYIRTLCTDIGKKLGYPATMDSLIRTESGNIKLDQCLSLDDIAQAINDKTLMEHLIPLDQALIYFPIAQLTAEWTSRAFDGWKLPKTEVSKASPDAFIRLYTHDSVFIGVYRYEETQAYWVPVKLFHPNKGAAQ